MEGSEITTLHHGGGRAAGWWASAFFMAVAFPNQFDPIGKRYAGARELYLADYRQPPPTSGPHSYSWRGRWRAGWDTRSISAKAEHRGEGTCQLF
jgi:hypothetical protein